MNYTPVNGMCDRNISIHEILVNAAHYSNIETIQFIVSTFGISEIILNELLWIAEKFHKMDLLRYLNNLKSVLGYEQ